MPAALIVSVILNILFMLLAMNMWLRIPAKTLQQGSKGLTSSRHAARSKELRDHINAHLLPHEELEYSRLWLQEANNIRGVSDRLDELENLAQMRLMTEE